MNNLEPDKWGSSYWKTLHFTAAAYDSNPNPSVKSAMKSHIRNLPLFLPCKECQDNAINFIKTQNLDSIVSNRTSLFKFFFNFHNNVNKRLNKPLMKIEDALKQYGIPSEDYKDYNLQRRPTEGIKYGGGLFILLLIFLFVFKH